MKIARVVLYYSASLCLLTLTLIMLVLAVMQIREMFR